MARSLMFSTLLALLLGACAPVDPSALDLTPDADTLPSAETGTADEAVPGDTPVEATVRDTAPRTTDTLPRPDVRAPSPDAGPPPADASAQDVPAAPDTPAPPPDVPAEVRCPALQQWREAVDSNGARRCVCTPGAITGAGCAGQDADCDGREDVLTVCGGQCTDTRRDPAHCGRCGAACAINAVCLSGACACPTGLTVCTNGCFAFPSNMERCAYCARYCLGRDRPDCCAMACAATTNCGGR